MPPAGASPTTPWALAEGEPKRYTLGEYLRLEERSEQLHEYLDGELKPVALGGVAALRSLDCELRLEELYEHIAF